MTKGGEGVGEMLTMADEGGREGDPIVFADLICEQPIRPGVFSSVLFKAMHFFLFSGRLENLYNYI